MIIGKCFELSKIVVEYKVKYPFMKPVEKTRWIQKKVESLGPTYIKMGQFLSNRGDLIDDVILKGALKKLHDDVDPIHWSDIESLIDEDKFTDIQKVPIAAASIGQVHRGTLKNGDEIVLKIRRPNVLKQVNNDINVIKGFLTILMLLSVESKKQQIRDAFSMVEDVKRALTKETDLKSELVNMELFNKLNLKTIRIPRVYKDLCNENVIVMEYIPSIKFMDCFEHTDTKSRKQLAFSIMNIFIRQFLYYGLIHGDPHPGNIALLPNQQTFVMYDFGTVVSLDRKTMNYFKLLVFELMNENLENVVSVLQNLDELVKINDINETKTYIASYMRYIKTIDVNEFKKAISKSSNEKLPIIFNSKFFEIIRIFGTIEGICLELDPDFSYDEIFANYSDVLFNDTDFLMMKSFQDTCSIIDML
jgi:predicted unusual protein kinase regulating ubiquinone biosynthesis (AarF/ABC1/UbiB family)